MSNSEIAGLKNIGFCIVILLASIAISVSHTPISAFYPAIIIGIIGVMLYMIFNIVCIGFVLTLLLFEKAKEYNINIFKVLKLTFVITLTFITIYANV